MSCDARRCGLRSSGAGNRRHCSAAWRRACPEEHRCPQDLFWVWETDVNLRFNYVSDAVADSLGYAAVDLLGRAWEEHLRADGDSPEQRAAHPFTDVPFYRVPVAGTHKDGCRSVRLEASAIPLFNSGGDVRGYLGVCHENECGGRMGESPARNTAVTSGFGTDADESAGGERG